MLASNGYPGMMAPAMQSGIGFQTGHHPNSHAQYNSPMAAFWQARHHMGPNGAAAAAGGAINGMAQSTHPLSHQTPVSSAHQGQHQDAKMAEKIVSELQVGMWLE